MTLYAPDLPDHIIHGTPGPPWSVLYILVSCWSGDERAMAGSTLMATSFPAIIWTPEKTVPQPPMAISSSTLYFPPNVCSMRSERRLLSDGCMLVRGETSVPEVYAGIYPGAQRA